MRRIERVDDNWQTAEKHSESRRKECDLACHAVLRSRLDLVPRGQMGFQVPLRFTIQDMCTSKSSCSDDGISCKRLDEHSSFLTSEEKGSRVRACKQGLKERTLSNEEVNFDTR